MYKGQVKNVMDYIDTAHSTLNLTNQNYLSVHFFTMCKM